MSMLNNEQLVAASTSLFSAYSQMRSTLLGKDFNDRQVSILLLLGARMLREQSGIVAEPMTKGRLEDLVARQLECDTRTAKDDVDELIEKEGMLEIRTSDKDRRVKILTLTANGEAMYRELATQSLYIVMDAAKAVKAAGKVATPPTVDEGGYKPYFRRMAWTVSRAAVALFFVALVCSPQPKTDLRADAAGFLEDGLKTAIHGTRDIDLT